MNDYKKLVIFLLGISFGFFIKDITFHLPILSVIDLIFFIIAIHLLKQ